MSAMQIGWGVKWQVDKHRDGVLYDTVTGEGNMLVNGGASALWDLFIGAAGVSAYSNANAYLGVGISSTTTTAAMTDLQGASTHREAMDVSYPMHTDHASDEAARSIVFQSTFETGDANFAWNEWALFNHASTGRMLNRKAVAMGTKTSADSWVLTVTLTFPA